MEQLTFLEPIFVLRSETGTIPPQISKKIELYASIDGHTPFVLARLEDTRGLSYTLFRDFALGTKFSLYVMSFNDKYIYELNNGVDVLELLKTERGIYHINDFFLSGSSGVMENPNSGDLSIELALAHRTMIEHDATVECYPRKSFNQLHTDLANWLINNNYVKNEKKFSSTEGASTDVVYRYRIGMSRFEYLTKYLAPKMSLDKMSVYSFIDDMGYYNFENIKRMFEKDSKVLLVLGDNNKPKDGYNSSFNFLGQVEIKVGGENFQKQIKAINSRSKYDLHVRQETVSGKIKLRTRLTEDDCYPIKKVLRAKPTDFTIVWGDGFGELVSRSINKTRDLDNLITFEGIINGFIGTQVQVGQRVDIQFANPMAKEEPHWINGGWVLSNVIHSYILGDGIKSSVKLQRPTFIRSECGISERFLSEFQIPDLDGEGKSASTAVFTSDTPTVKPVENITSDLIMEAF